jgi:hypothetical protein
VLTEAVQGNLDGFVAFSARAIHRFHQLAFAYCARRPGDIRCMNVNGDAGTCERREARSSTDGALAGNPARTFA